MGAGIAGPRMAPTVAERVELLHIADGEAGLGLDPGPQPDPEGAVGERIEGTERQAGPRFIPAFAGIPITGDQDRRFIAFDGDDRGGESDLDRRQRDLGHGCGAHSRSSRNGSPSNAMTPRPIPSIAVVMRPSRPSARSASAARRELVAAV